MLRALIAAAVLIALFVTVVYRPAGNGYGWTVGRPATVRTYDCLLDNGFRIPAGATTQRYGETQPPLPPCAGQLLATGSTASWEDPVAEPLVPTIEDTSPSSSWRRSPTVRWAALSS